MTAIQEQKFKKNTSWLAADGWSVAEYYYLNN